MNVNSLNLPVVFRMLLVLQDFDILLDVRDLSSLWCTSSYGWILTSVRIETFGLTGSLLHLVCLGLVFTRQILKCMGGPRALSGVSSVTWEVAVAILSGLAENRGNIPHDINNIKIIILYTNL